MKTTPERRRRSLRPVPLRRPTLVKTLRRDIERSDDTGPDWPTAVEDAVLRQDLEWVIEAQSVEKNQMDPPPQTSAQAKNITATTMPR